MKKTILVTFDQDIFYWELRRNPLSTVKSLGFNIISTKRDDQIGCTYYKVETNTDISLPKHILLH